MKPRRLIYAGVGLLGAVALIACGTLLWLVATDSGARFVIDRVAGASQGAFEYAGIGGRFSDEVELTGLRVTGDGFELEIDRVLVRLSLPDLLGGTLVIESLRSGNVRARLLAADGPEPQAGGEPFAVPVAIRIARASIDGFRLEGRGNPVELNRIVLSGSIAGHEAAIQRLEMRWQDFFLSTQGGLAWREGFALDLLLSASGGFRGQQWLGSAELSGTWPRLEIEQELLEPYLLSATGSLVLSDEPAFDLRFTAPDAGELSATGGFDADDSTWRADIAAESLDVGRFVPGAPDALDLAGGVALTPGEALRVASEGIRFEAAYGDETLTGDIAGVFDAPSTFEIERLDLAYGDNRAAVSGRVGETLDLTLTAALGELAALVALLEANALAPPATVAGLATLRGTAGADLRLTGNPRLPDIGGEFSIDEASYAGVPLAMVLRFAAPGPAAGGITIERFAASLGASEIEASGTVAAGLLGTDGLIGAGPGPSLLDAGLDLELEASLADLAELADLVTRVGLVPPAAIGAEIPDLSGAASASLAVAGSLRRPELDGELEVMPLVYEGRTLTRAALAAQGGIYPGGMANLSLEAAAADLSLALEAEGQLAAAGWSGTVSSLTVGERLLGSWRLTSPVPVTVSRDRIEFAGACLVNGGSEVCAEWRYGAGQSERILISATDFELAVLGPLLPEGVSLSGRMAFAAELDTATSRPVGNLTASGSNIGFGVELSEADQVTTELESVALEAGLDDFAVTLDATVRSPAEGSIRLSMRADDLRDPNAAIDGRVDIAWPDLSAAALLSPEIGEVGGRLEISVDVGGSAADPTLAGNAALDAGSVTVPAWGIVVDRIEASALSFDGDSLEFSGNGFIDDAELRMSGVTELDPATGWPTRLSISGENLPIARRSDATVFATPAFDVAIRLPQIDVTGSVFVPRAAISVAGLPPQAVGVSPDSVVHGSAVEEPVRPLQLTADVTVELGNAVRYRGSGLDAQLAGSLELQYRSGLSPTASGSVSMDGTYDAYGQSLALERGELLFAGSLNDPALDVLAVREIDSTTVGVRLSGTLAAPEASIYSDPQLSDANALSYLMLGRPLSTSDDQEAATLQSAALALGLQQALPAVQRVGETLGLDELSIEATELDAGALMAGKYLNPKVYISYSYGLFNRLGGFLLRYDINDRFSLETRSGQEKSMDLLYSIEKE